MKTTIRPGHLLATALAATLGLFTGCTTNTYTVQVDAISKPTTATAQAATPPPQSYYIHSKNPRLDTSPVARSAPPWAKFTNNSPDVSAMNFGIPMATKLSTPACTGTST